MWVYLCAKCFHFYLSNFFCKLQFYFFFIFFSISYSGVVEGTISTSGQLAKYPWTSDINNYLPTDRQANNSFTLAVVDPNYKMPQIWRSSLGIDYKIANNYIVSIDYTHSQDLSAPFYYNANLDLNSTTTDASGRQI